MRVHDMKYSVISISSSGVSSAVFLDNSDPLILRERQTMSVRNYIDDGKLSSRGIERLVELILEAKSRCYSVGVDLAWLIATDSLRSIKNLSRVRNEVKARTGMEINLIEAETEALCDAAANRSAREYDSPVIIDLGGSSIELFDFNGKEESVICLDFGLDDLTRKFVKRIYPTKKEADEIKNYLKKKLKAMDIPKAGKYKTAVLSGSITQSIYDVYCDYEDIPIVDKADKVMEPEGFRKLSKHLFDGSKRSMIVIKNAPDKLHTIGTAMVVLRTLLKRFQVSCVKVSDYGVKEGYMRLILEDSVSGESYRFSYDDNAQKDKDGEVSSDGQ